MDDALADTDTHTAIAINAASDIAIAISAVAANVRGQAPSSPPHASHICMHVMLAYGDADLVLAMKADTATTVSMPTPTPSSTPTPTPP